MANGYACRNPNCETLCYPSGEPVTYAGWYGDVDFYLDSYGHAQAKGAACSEHRETREEQELQSKWEEVSYLLHHKEQELQNLLPEDEFLRPRLTRELQETRGEERRLRAEFERVRGW